MNRVRTVVESRSGSPFLARILSCVAPSAMRPRGKQEWNRQLQSKIGMVLFSGYLFDEFPPVDGGFLCSDAVIVADDIILSIEPYEDYLQYDELSGYSPNLFCKPITETTEEIRFISSFWSGKNLTAIAFQCGDVTVTVSADKEKQCMMVVHN